MKAEKGFRLAVLSGKGGTGKTLLSVNLAAVIKNSAYIDCDVEEPNGHLFFKPEIESSKEVTVKIPQIDNELCDGCRKCVEFCRFNALAFIKDRVKVFDEICHSCGGCEILCPRDAISNRDVSVGIVQKGMSQGVKTLTGTLEVGKASGVPVIKNLLDEDLSDRETIVIDCPPGSACVVMESIRDADYCVLVAEPTIFGTHNLAMVHELVTLFEIPYGVLLNKCTEGDNPSEKFCIENNIPILGRIDFDPELGRINSEGEILARQSEKYKKMFESIYSDILREVAHETVADTKR
ncbi:nucleotide-binding protein [Alkalibacter mobilis]|uniref:nucleotide-binding protein n=1 Tax=Alkalibacter mobilis TaxID=2787712 RepID=UPI00189D3DE0|nr:ATP-binding protein [Alkalibacter mobilis]MBF7096198.1 ATP-binding protein [Alkalibacter mobilis]